MRNLLVDRARAHLAAKRGGGLKPLDLDEFEWVSDENLETVAELDEALRRLDALSTRQGQLLQHRYFGGLTLEESAAAMGVSSRRRVCTRRSWRLPRAARILSSHRARSTLRIVQVVPRKWGTEFLE
jgi:DNA-directed RNA polymerase specialized sigma24 family protein